MKWQCGSFSSKIPWDEIKHLSRISLWDDGADLMLSLPGYSKRGSMLASCTVTALLFRATDRPQSPQHLKKERKEPQTAEPPILNPVMMLWCCSFPLTYKCSLQQDLHQKTSPCIFVVNHQHVKRKPEQKINQWMTLLQENFSLSVWLLFSSFLISLWENYTHQETFLRTHIFHFCQKKKKPRTKKTP